MRRWLNVLGLVFAMIGVVIIFFWGPPQPSFEAVALGPAIDRPLPEYGGKTARELNAETASIKERYLRISQLGLVFVFIGFGCQLIAVWPGRSN